jgi:parvulin-like peptidyl-prolyl isomerase
VNHRNLGRLVALVVLIVIGSALAGACSSTLEDAATVTYEAGDGSTTVHIRRDEFEDQVRDLASSEQILQSLQAQGVESRPDGTADARLTALWLNQLVSQVAIDAEFEARGLDVTDAQREQVAANFETLTDAPQSIVDELIDQQARATALAEAIGGDVPDAVAPTDAELRELYDQNQESIAACASGKEVSHILVADEATAIDLADQLVDGASFAELATSQSTDTGSAARGGSLGCLGAQQFVEAFQQAADSAPLDEVVGPVPTEFGYHLVLVTAWRPSFEKFRDQLAQQASGQAQQRVQQQRDQLLRDAINERLAAMDVTVDPRFGTWEEREGSFGVVPPVVPEPREQREPTTTTTAAVPGIVGG